MSWNVQQVNFESDSAELQKPVSSTDDVVNYESELSPPTRSKPVTTTQPKSTVTKSKTLSNPSSVPVLKDSDEVGVHRSLQRDAAEKGASNSLSANADDDDLCSIYSKDSGIPDMTFDYHPVPIILNMGKLEESLPPLSSSPQSGYGTQSPPTRDPGLGTPETPRRTAFVSSDYVRPLSLASPGDDVSSSQLNLVMSSTPEQQGSNSNLVELEKVRLQGQLEVLSTETELAMRQRAQLTAELEALRQKLNIPSENSQGPVAYLKRSLLDAQKNKSGLESELRKTQEALDAKISEAKLLLDELHLTKETSNELKSEVSKLYESIDAKDSTVQSLKTRIAELYVEVENFKHGKEFYDTEVQSLNSEIVSLRKTRDFYNEQLTATQETRDRLQVELSKLQSIVSTDNEKLNYDNNSLRLKLAQLEASMIDERHEWMNRLEIIRAEIIEREAVLEQLLQERDALQEAVDFKVRQLEREREAYDKLEDSYKEIETESERLSSLLAEKSHMLEAAEVDKISLQKQITYLEECFSQKTNEVESNIAKIAELNQHIDESKELNDIKDSIIENLESEKEALEGTLLRCRGDKDALDKYINDLRGDMLKVEESFQHMRQELEDRTTQLGHVTQLKDDLQNELQKTCGELQEKAGILVSLTQEKEELLKTLQQLKTENIGLNGDLENYKVKLEGAEFKIAELENVRQSLMENNEDLTNQLTVSNSEIGSLKETIRSLRSEVEALTCEHKKYLKLIDEHENLKQKYDQLAQQHEKMIREYTAEVTLLNAKISDQEKKFLDEKTVYAEKVANLQQELTDLSEKRNALEVNLADAQSLMENTVKSMTSDHSQKVEELQSIISKLKEEKAALELQVSSVSNELQTLTSQFNNQLFEAREEVTQLKEQLDIAKGFKAQNQTLKMDLERTHGRLDGLLQSQTQMKEHINVLEKALAEREASINTLAAKSEEHVSYAESARDLATCRIADLESQILQVMSSRSQLQEQLEKSSNNASRLLLEVEALKTERTRLQNDLTQTQACKDEEIGTLNNDIGLKSQQLQSLFADMAVLKSEFDSVKSELEELKAKNLDLVLKQTEKELALRGQELVDLEGRLQTNTINYSDEIEGLKKIVKTTEGENRKLRDDLELVRKEKLENMAKLATLRGALKAAVDRHRLFTSAEPNHVSEDGIDWSALEKLIGDSVPSYWQVRPPKPLNSVNDCLEQLKARMANLSTSMTENTMAVKARSQWSEMETEAQKLQTACDKVETVLKAEKQAAQ